MVTLASSFVGYFFVPGFLGGLKGSLGTFSNKRVQLVPFFYAYLLRVQKSNFFPMGDFLTPNKYSLKKKGANRISVSENVPGDVF